MSKRDEGYGFIKPAEGDKDVFFHATAVVDNGFDDINAGDEVTFDVEEGPKGPAAANVQKAAPAPAADDAASDDAATDAPAEAEETPAAE